MKLASKLETDPGLQPLIKQFVLSLNSRIGAIRGAYEENSLEKVSNLSHQLKGAAGLYGFEDLRSIAFDLEKTSQEKDWSDRVEYLISSLENLISETNH